MSNDYFKPSVAHWWNEPITFGISFSNRKKQFGRTKVLGTRLNKKGNTEYVWADPVKAGLPNNLHLKNITYGYVPSGESSTYITWFDRGTKMSLNDIQYLTFNGIRIRKAEYDDLFAPNQKVYPDSIVKLKQLGSLQVSLPHTVTRLRNTGEWHNIGVKRTTSTALQRFDIWRWISSFHGGQPYESLQAMKTYTRGTLHIPHKALGLSVHKNNYASMFGSFTCLYQEGQHSGLEGYQLV